MGLFRKIHHPNVGGKKLTFGGRRDEEKNSEFPERPCRLRPSHTIDGLSCDGNLCLCKGSLKDIEEEKMMKKVNAQAFLWVALVVALACVIAWALGQNPKQKTSERTKLWFQDELVMTKEGEASWSDLGQDISHVSYRPECSFYHRNYKSQDDLGK
jgi:hypothetical protein